jgi:enoyl-CoA hydratase
MTDKEAAVRGFGQDLRTGLLIEAECFNRTTNMEETKAGVNRFRNRDHPDCRKDGGKALTPGLVRPNSKL